LPYRFSPFFERTEKGRQLAFSGLVNKIEEEEFMPWIIDFYATGEKFRPSENDYVFSKSIDAGTIQTTDRYRNQPAPYGVIMIEVPKHIPNQERITYIVKVAQELLPELIKAGATEWRLNIGRFYLTQCNEDYTSEELALMASLKCPLFYSAYKVSKKEERKLMEKYGGFES
jgi:hypothetical protein